MTSHVADQPVYNKDLRVWTLVAVYFVVAVAAFSQAGFYISAKTVLSMAGLAGVGSVVSIAAIWTMPRSRVLRIVSALHMQLIYGLASAMLSYSAAVVKRPLVDAAMLRADKAIGYDWYTYMSFMAASPALSDILTFAYNSLFWQMFIITLMAGWSRDRTQLQQIITAHMMVLMMTIGLFCLWPVTTAWVHLRIDDETLQSLQLVRGGWPQQLLDLRAGRVTEVVPMMNFGIIGFPSYHCAAGLINIWASWRYPWLRWPMISLAATMILSTPINGGHYIVDLIGAVFVAIIGVWLAGRFVSAPTMTIAWPRRSDDRTQAAMAV